MSSITITNPRAAQSQLSAFTTSTTSITTPTLVNGSSIAPAGAGNFFTASADEILFLISDVGTLTSDCTLELQVTIGSTGVVEVLRLFTNAELTAMVAGTAATAYIIRLGYGTKFRWQIKVGTMTGANGVALRFNN